MKSAECSKGEEIRTIQMQKPHLVILGAGASVAAAPNGDKNGRHLPIMDNFIDMLQLDSLLGEIGIEFEGGNFEIVYSQLYKKPKLRELKSKLERKIYDYFYSLELPDYPTIYDHLVLSLREKDVIATFNWDPFLIQAYTRNRDKFLLPKLNFLHGNVMVGFCENDRVKGINGDVCNKCKELLKPSKLLYPITEKNYDADEFIENEWKVFEWALNNAFMFTIFGYGTPKTDVKAIEFMKKAWGEPQQRAVEEVEIVDIKTESELMQAWGDFIYSHHYMVCDNFYDSWIANHPRRTGEAYINQFRGGRFIEDNKLPKELDFDELWKWLLPLKEIELSNY